MIRKALLVSVLLASFGSICAAQEQMKVRQGCFTNDGEVEILIHPTGIVGEITFRLRNTDGLVSLATWQAQDGVTHIFRVPALACLTGPCTASLAFRTESLGDSRIGGPVHRVPRSVEPGEPNPLVSGDCD